MVVLLYEQRYSLRIDVKIKMSTTIEQQQYRWRRKSIKTCNNFDAFVRASVCIQKLRRLWTKKTLIETRSSIKSQSIKSNHVELKRKIATRLPQPSSYQHFTVRCRVLHFKSSVFSRRIWVKDNEKFRSRWRVFWWYFSSTKATKFFCVSWVSIIDFQVIIVTTVMILKLKN